MFSGIFENEMQRRVAIINFVYFFSYVEQTKIEFISEVLSIFEEALTDDDDDDWLMGHESRMSCPCLKKIELNVQSFAVQLSLCFCLFMTVVV